MECETTVYDKVVEPLPVHRAQMVVAEGISHVLESLHGVIADGQSYVPGSAGMANIPSTSL